jgi:hypothetical protein
VEWAVEMFGIKVGLAKPECASEAQEKREFKYSVTAHSTQRAEYRIESGKRAMIFELERRIRGSTTSIYSKSLYTVIVAVLRVAALR